MINKKIALSLMSIVAALSIMAGVTYAYFNDVGTSNNNVFAAGTFDLKLSDDTPETNQDNVTASFGGTNLAPGSCTSSQQLRLKNSGTVAGNHADITTSNSDSAMAAFLRIQTLNYDSVDVRSKIPESGSDGNTFLDLADWAADLKGVEDLPLTNLGTDHTFDIVVCLDESASNPQQSQSDTLNITATLMQQSHGSE